MKLRTRLALVSAIAVAGVIVAAAFGAARVARNEFLNEIDESLRQRAAAIEQFDDLVSSGQPLGRAAERFGPGNPFGRGPADELFQALFRDGRIRPLSGQEPIPYGELDLAVAAGRAPATIRTVTTDDGSYRILTVPYSNGAIQVARSLEEFNRSTGRLARTLTVAGGLGVLLAGGAGLVIARSALKPVDELTETVEHVTETRELGARIAVERNDEVGRLAASFNEMLGALQSSRLEQERLVRDAGHELRTPLTALRTNIELLARGRSMDEEQRTELLEAATEELRELSALTAELVALAADPDAATEQTVPVGLGEIAESVAERFRRRSRHPITVASDGSTVDGRMTELERAISNLVDNAVKWSPDGEPVAISVSGGRVVVADAGPGIPAGDEARIFDRFYRADAARTTPGSGLGLAIVRKIVEGHGGTVFAGTSEQGGAAVGFQLPA